VILGNPPYSVSSVNKSDFIEQEMELYKEDVREEKNIQPLSDDYIKFIRFAHWKIDKEGKGIIGMITNNSYLSGLIHRGMRKKLLDSFDEIYILNLHGNSRIGEKHPDGSKDENVFDIQQGVSIVLFIKKDQKGKACNIFYQDVYGLRENKYDLLGKSDSHTTEWKPLSPVEPYYFFVEKDFSLQVNYDKFIPMTEIFDKSSSGVKTHRDHFVVGFTDEEIKQRMRTFISNLPDDLVAQSLDLKDTRDWNLKTAREEVKKIEWEKYIRHYAYRPFDIRKACYLPDLIDRGCDRWDLMQNFFKDNLGLCVTRQLSTSSFCHAIVTDKITDMCFISIKTRETGYVFPLYIYKKAETGKKSSLKSIMLLFEPKSDYFVRKPNITPAFSENMSKAFKKSPSPEEIFYYIYAVLYSETYRTKYAEFLKIDFPRVPFTKDYKLFKKMSDYGKMLADLHLLKSTELDSPITRFQGKGDNRVKKLKYDDKDGILYINKEQYFEGISQDVWSYQIGGYQVCDKWLKDRKERILSLNEIQTYCKIVTSIQKTIEIQKAIDEVYNDVEREIIGLKVMENKNF
jgi:predicted helicase